MRYWHDGHMLYISSVVEISGISAWFHERTRHAPCGSKSWQLQWSSCLCVNIKIWINVSFVLVSLMIFVTSIVNFFSVPGQISCWNIKTETPHVFMLAMDFGSNWRNVLLFVQSMWVLLYGSEKFCHYIEYWSTQKLQGQNVCPVTGSQHHCLCINILMMIKCMQKRIHVLQEVVTW